MHILLRFACCLLLAALLAPVPVSLADDTDGAPGSKEQAAKPAIRQFTDAEISAARQALADLTAEQRALLNHLRYLLRPQYEDELMAGRAFAPCPLPAFEQPAEAVNSLEALRLWAVLASGMPLADSTTQRLRLLMDAPVPTVGNSLGELGLHMAVCAYAARHAELGLADALKERAADLLAAAEDAKRTTAENSPLMNGRTIDPAWYANHLWRALICRFALELQLKISDRTWEASLRDLLGAGHETHGWRSSSGPNSEAQDMGSNLFAIAALSLASTTPAGVLPESIARKVATSLEKVPAVLKRLDTDFAGVPRVGSRLAVLCSLDTRLVPEGADAATWRDAFVQSAMQQQDLSGVVREGLGRELGLVDGGHSLRVCETAMACIALSGGMNGNQAPLAGMSVPQLGRALHACSVFHAVGLPEGSRRTFSGQGHELPEPGKIETFMLNGLEYLIDTQHKDGGWGSAWAAVHGRGGQAAAGCDPGTTAFVALALMRAGHTPYEGAHKDAVLKATEYIVDAVEKAGDDGPRITSITGTQLQGKLGQIVDTALVTQFLARVLHTTESDRALHQRVGEALDKCIGKIEAAQAEDGGWITQGWAPVLQSAMFNQALELALLAGREVDSAVLQRSRGYLGRDIEIEVDDRKTEAVKSTKRAASAGVAFYAGSSALRSAAGDTAEVTIAMDRAIKNGTLRAHAEVSEANLRKIGYSNEDAAAKITAYKQYEVLCKKLGDESYLKGFGNNGGEEFISYMMSSESIVITGHETWSKWNEKMHTTFQKIQNTDGSWSGHHCISSPVLCTAAVLLCLTADREVHVLVETGPQGKTVAGKSKKPDKKPEKKADAPVTGK